MEESKLPKTIINEIDADKKTFYKNEMIALRFDIESRNWQKA
jgi:hypothetical protein